MNSKKALIFGLSIFAGLASNAGIRRTRPTNQNSLPIFYAGTWRYADQFSGRKHLLQISPDLSMQIDGHPVKTTVESVDDQSLIYLDSYGYHLKIAANEQQPVSLFDEADDCTYIIEKI